MLSESGEDTSLRSMENTDQTADASEPPVEKPDAPSADTTLAEAERAQDVAAITELICKLGARLDNLTDKVGDKLAVIAKGFHGLIEEQRRLHGAVSSAREDVEAVKNYSKRAVDDDLDHAHKQVAGALDDILGELIYPIHDQLFKRVCAMEAGQDNPDGFTINLLSNLEGCLERIDVLVVKPQPGEPFEITHMEAAESLPCRFWRKPNSVARVLNCGFVTGQEKVLRKARVAVYRKQ